MSNETPFEAVYDLNCGATHASIQASPHGPAKAGRAAMMTWTTAV